AGDAVGTLGGTAQVGSAQTYAWGIRRFLECASGVLGLHFALSDLQRRECGRLTAGRNAAAKRVTRAGGVHSRAPALQRASAREIARTCCWPSRSSLRN